MKYLIWWLGLSVLFLLQTVLPVNLLLLFTLASAWRGRTPEAWVVALMAGILADVVSGLPDGVLVLTYLIVAAAGRLVAHSVIERKINPILWILLGGSATLLYYGLVWLGSALAAGLGLGEVLAWQFWTTSRPWVELAGNLILAYPVLRFYGLCQTLIRSN